MPTSSSDYSPPPEEIRELIRKIREKWKMNPYAILAHQKKIDRLLDGMTGVNLPQKSSELFRVDTERMRQNFEKYRSTVKDD